MTRLQPITAARPALWNEEPHAAALLADCAANPPRRQHHVDRYAVSCDHWSEYSRRDPRVRALVAMHEAAFEAVMDEDRDTALAVLDLNVDAAIDQAIAAIARARGETEHV